MRFKSECYCRKAVCQQVNKQQMHRCERNRKTCDRSVEHSENRAKVSRKQKLDGVFNVPVNISSVFYRFYDRCKVIICQYHRRCIFRYFTSGDSHCNTNIRLFQRRRIVYSVTCHRYNISLFLPCTYNTDFMFRRNTGIYGNSLYKIFQFFIGKFINLRTFTCFRLIFQNTDSFRNRRSRHFMISRDHNRTNTRLLTFRYSSFGFFTRRIHHCDQADKRKIIFVFQSQFQLV